MNNSVSSINTAVSKVSVMSKLYVWSIVLESLLFFIIANPDLIGVTANVSKILQFSVFLGLILRIATLRTNLMVSSPFNSFNKWFFYYFIFAIFSGVFGFLSGAYNIESEVGVINTIRIFTRPFLEYFIMLYYFAYFVILPRYLLNNTKAIDYFFKIFVAVFFLSLFVGIGDLVLMKVISGYDGLPRHLSDGTQVGWRFHGLAGEPRDAFVYLMLGLGILTLRDMWKNRKRLSYPLIAMVAFAALLTQSASGLFGVFFSIFLILIFLFHKLSFHQKIKYLFSIIVAVIFVVVAVYSSDRILLYYDAFFELIETLNSGEKVTSILSVTMNNIYPLWQRWLEVIEFNFFPSIIGTGLGSTSIVNNNFSNTFEIVNPNANIIRTFYETGIIGIYLFIYAFLNPIKRLNISRQEYLKLAMLMLLMLGMFFSHRSVAPFLFLGIVLTIFNVKELRR